MNKAELWGQIWENHRKMICYDADETFASALWWMKLILISILSILCFIIIIIYFPK